ncbi:4-hydroxy-tetrahydrodipicolinate synthase [bacterium I07]|nr:4-hydroxy-tetrahydrodipicolinate synthase [bacterium I07]
MHNITRLKGCGTALVTPFNQNGGVDEKSLRNLVDFQINGSIDFLVPCGTTGESATLTRNEHLKVVEIVVDQTGGRVPVIAGAGGYNTAAVIEMAKSVESLGVDGVLSVTPYYNKPTQEGLFQHYAALAANIEAPIIVYNVPGRTSTNLLPDTIVRLSSIDNIIGVKEASGDMSQIGELAVKIPDDFFLLSGDDANTLPIIAMGGNGVISVVSNQAPDLVRALAHACLDGDFRKAGQMQRKLFPLMQANFIRTNPIPVKAGLAMMGLIDEIYRLPLVPLDSGDKDVLKSALSELDLL